MNFFGIKTLIFLFLLISSFFVFSANSSVVLDRVNVDNYLKHPQMVETHIRCLLYDGPCDAIGQEFKRLLPTVAHSQCGPCTPSQRTKLQKIIKHWQTNYPNAWNDMQFQISQGKYRQ